MVSQSLVSSNDFYCFDLIFTLQQNNKKIDSITKNGCNRCHPLQARVCVGQKAHASVRLHGLGGVVLQLPGPAERWPTKGVQPLPGHLSKVNHLRANMHSFLSWLLLGEGWYPLDRSPVWPTNQKSLMQSFSHAALCRLMSCMNVTSADTEVEAAVKYFYLLACKPEES